MNETTGTGYTYPQRPPCYVNKCDSCAYRGTCANANNGCYYPISITYTTQAGGQCQTLQR